MLLQVIPPSVEPITLAEAKVHLRVDDDLTAEDALIKRMLAGARRFAESYLGRSLIAQSWRLVADAFPGPGCYGVAFGRTYSMPPNAFQLDRGNVLAVSSVQYLDMNSVWQTLAPVVYVAELSGCPARLAPAFAQVWPPSLPQIGAVKVDYLAGYATGITADATADTITPALWTTLAVGDPVTFSVSGSATAALPQPLVPGVTYYVHSVPVVGSYKLTASVGGAAIDLTDIGSGQCYLGVVPEGIRDWMLLRIGSLYENRKEQVTMQRVTVQPLPYVDRLLDPYSVVLA